MLSRTNLKIPTKRTPEPYFPYRAVQISSPHFNYYNDIYKVFSPQIFKKTRCEAFVLRAAETKLYDRKSDWITWIRKSLGNKWLEHGGCAADCNELVVPASSQISVGHQFDPGKSLCFFIFLFFYPLEWINSIFCYSNLSEFISLFTLRPIMKAEGDTIQWPLTVVNYYTWLNYIYNGDDILDHRTSCTPRNCRDSWNTNMCVVSSFLGT